MARVFTTSFLHNGNSYLAVVSQLKNAVNVYIPDVDLHHIIPNGRAVFHLDDGKIIDQSQPDPVQHLLSDIYISMKALV